MFALICHEFAATLNLLLPFFQLLLLPLFQLPLLPLIQNLGFGMASESARFSFTSLLTGGTFRPDPARPHFGSLPPVKLPGPHTGPRTVLPINKIRINKLFRKAYLSKHSSPRIEGSCTSGLHLRNLSINM